LGQCCLERKTRNLREAAAFGSIGDEPGEDQVMEMATALEQQAMLLLQSMSRSQEQGKPH
jgi:hypothetical protein